MMSEQNKREAIAHKQTWELLPWYVNGTLDHKEREAVTDHISGCQSCQDEIRRCRAIESGVRGRQGVAWSPSPEHFARLMERIDRATPSTTMEQWRIRLREWIEETRLALHETTSSVRWALAAQCMVIALLAGGLLWQASMITPSAYRTLSDLAMTEPVSAHIRVVFAEDITERELRAVLSSIQGTIVAGPTQMAVYTVAVPATAGDAARRTEALQALRAHPKVRLAEPIQP